MRDLLRAQSLINRTELIDSRSNEADDKTQEVKDEFNQSLGKVYLVGAGPGDAELLTLKAYRLICNADVIFYDSLVSDDILKLPAHHVKMIHVGKRAKCHSANQDDINQLLVSAAKRYKNIVRLKGGDPFVFGRGGEELQVLSDARIAFEVVPGITAASGCSSYAGIPLTHRDFSQSVHLVTAHEKNNASSIDWKGLSKDNQTLVFYMGLLKNKSISEQLIKNGLADDTPVAVIENGTRENQNVFTGTIGELSELVNKNEIRMPALIIVGKVVALQQQLNWFNNRTDKYKTPIKQLNNIEGLSNLANIA